MAERSSGSSRRGAVIIPAYNEATVIGRTLVPLGRAAAEGCFELVVVCNGCTDDTAAVARKIPGVRVVELPEGGSKPAALNVGDRVVSLWPPRLYLDADIRISAAAVLDVLDRLARGDVCAARPVFRYDFAAADPLVRSYYRARQRIRRETVLWGGAGVYGLAEAGHVRFGSFPRPHRGGRPFRRRPVRPGREGRRRYGTCGGDDSDRRRESARDPASRPTGGCRRSSYRRRPHRIYRSGHSTCGVAVDSRTGYGGGCAGVSRLWAGGARGGARRQTGGDGSGTRAAGPAGDRSHFRAQPSVPSMR